MIATARTILRKDLLIEARSREIVFTTLFFAVACTLVFAFGFVQEGRAVEGAAARSRASMKASTTRTGLSAPIASSSRSGKSVA